MSFQILHPALGQLLHFQTAAKLRRLATTLSTPRRRARSLLALALATLFFGNVIVSVLFRQPFPAGTISRFFPLVLFVYCLWHVVKVVYRQPEQGIEWSTAERELVCAGPFRRRELLAYRFVTIVLSAVLKAGCFTLLMRVDLPLPAAAFIGVLAALLFLELFRMCIETAAWAVSRRTHVIFRLGALLVAATALCSVLNSGVIAPDAQSTYLSSGTDGRLIDGLITASDRLRDSTIVRTGEAPFTVFADVVTASEYSQGLLVSTAMAMVIVGLMAWLVVWSDGYFYRRRIDRERSSYARIEFHQDAEVFHGRSVCSQIPHVRWYGGSGPLAWRQAVGVSRYVSSLLIALGVVGGMSFMPVLVFSNSIVVMLNVVASLAFYTFLLLPTSLKFDFRRDIDRLSLLKTLPIRPLSLVLGQLATPVLMATATQLLVLVLASLVHPVGPGLLVFAMLLLFCSNVLIFALDNLIFLLYPSRVGQEGLDVFLRTTLTFTAKGLIFGLGLVLMYGWFALSSIVASLTDVGGGPLVDARLLFAIGTMSMLCLATATTIYLLVQTFCRFDPSCDTPA
jgi:hypothetical protein